MIRNCIVLALIIACALAVLCGCESASVLGRAIVESAADSASELDSEYGATTFKHTTKRRIRCGACGGDGIVSEDEAILGNPVGECRICHGKGWTDEF